MIKNDRDKVKLTSSKEELTVTRKMVCFFWCKVEKSCTFKFKTVLPEVTKCWEEEKKSENKITEVLYCWGEEDTNVSKNLLHNNTLWNILMLV